MATAIVRARITVPVGLPEQSESLRKAQEDVLRRMGTAALCPAPVRTPSGPVQLPSDFCFMPRAKI